jgi:UDP-N-acetylmuramoyl-tripeptide--D-alanyl-D-alanine ligase
MRKQLASVLRWQAKKFIAKNKPKVVCITGSVGKTSTTQAISTILSQSFTVRSTIGNYNTDIGVPCSILGNNFPSNLKNPFGWMFLLTKNQLQLLVSRKVDVLVLELGTDSPGDIAEFSWLLPDIAIVTAVSPEHMEFFKTLDAVAVEELSIAKFSEKTIVNKQMVAGEFLQFAESDQLYNYSRHDIQHVSLKPEDLLVVGEHSIDAVSAGLAVGRELGMQLSSLQTGAKAVESQPGRMRVLDGIKSSKLVDDTYNSSPDAVIAALDYLYTVDSPQRIALLGNMNELGEISATEHTKIGKYCNPKKLDLVVTLGEDANHYLADAAKENGCAVAEAQTPQEAANIIKNQLADGGSIVLCKGSQNGVFAEEAVKLLLANPEDESKLVRQSAFWQKKKTDNLKKEFLK